MLSFCFDFDATLLWLLLYFVVVAVAVFFVVSIGDTKVLIALKLSAPLISHNRSVSELLC